MESGYLLRIAETSRRLLAARGRALGGGGIPLPSEEVRRRIGFPPRSDPRITTVFTGRRAFYQREMLEDLLEWMKESGDLATGVVHLCEMTRRDPFEGPGRPTSLLGVLDGVWTRSLNGPHRLVYCATDDRVDFLIARVRWTIPKAPETAKAAEATETTEATERTEAKEAPGTGAPSEPPEPEPNAPDKG